MFCSAVNAIEMCKTEGVVDVFQVVRALRIQKPGAVQNVVRKTEVAHHKIVITIIIIILISAGSVSIRI